MKSGRQSVHWLWATDHLPFFYFWGIAPAFPPIHVSGALPQFFLSLPFLGHCPSFSSLFRFWGIAPAFLSFHISGALPQLFCPFIFLGHCPSFFALSQFWGNSTHAKKSEVLTSNVNRPARFHRTDPFTCMLVAIAPRPLSHENSRATPSSIQSALRLRQAVFTPSICHLLQSISCQTICCPYVHGFCS